MDKEEPTGLDVGCEIATVGNEGVRSCAEALGGGADICVDGKEQAIEQGLRTQHIIE